MADLFRTCPDGHRCQHGSLCVEAEEGSYYCDCSTSTGDYAGLSCEFAAENYCLGTDGFALVWCTNRGLCQISPSNLWYCECPPEYDGPHCEYVAGAKPSDWPSYEPAKSQATPQKKDGLAVGVSVTIALVTIVVGLMLGFLVYRSIRQRRSMEVGDEKSPKDHSEPHHLAAHGAGFHDEVLSVQSSNANEHYEFDADSVEVDAELPSPKVSSPTAFGAPPMNGRHGGGHGMIV
mmetsp:Transcript_81695/g.236034  ORF Transcript_81695/g.236034 Transcript_81695/m.236034 type:complete len:234 (+) Transcript_81695:249-950(+)